MDFLTKHLAPEWNLTKGHPLPLSASGYALQCHAWCLGECSRHLHPPPCRGCWSGGSLCFSHKCALTLISIWLWRDRQVRPPARTHSSCDDPTHDVISACSCLGRFCLLFAWEFSRWLPCEVSSVYYLVHNPVSLRIWLFSKVAQQGIPKIEPPSLKTAVRFPCSFHCPQPWEIVFCILFHWAAWFSLYLRMKLLKGSDSSLLNHVCLEPKPLLPGWFLRNPVFSSWSSTDMCFGEQPLVWTDTIQGQKILESSKLLRELSQASTHWIRAQSTFWFWFYNFSGHVLSIIIRGLWLSYILLLSECFYWAIGYLTNHRHLAEIKGLFEIFNLRKNTFSFWHTERLCISVLLRG